MGKKKSNYLLVKFKINSLILYENQNIPQELESYVRDNDSLHPYFEISFSGLKPKNSFKIPSNLYIIGTMNSSDKSIALIDIALRRRFTFLKMEPRAELVPKNLQKLFIELNEYISDTLGNDYQIGHSYFMDIEGDDDLDFVLKYKIKPLLEEYFYGDSEGLETALEIIEK